MAQEYLKSGAVEEALAYLQLVLTMPDSKGMTRTKVQAAKTLVANAAKISSKKTQLQLDGAVTSLSMSDLLALAGQADADSRSAQPGVNGALPTSSEPASDAGFSPALGSGDDLQEPLAGGSAYLTESPCDTDRLPAEPTEGHGSASVSQAPADTPRGNERKGDPTEGLRDTSSSDDIQELDG